MNWSREPDASRERPAASGGNGRLWQRIALATLLAVAAGWSLKLALPLLRPNVEGLLDESRALLDTTAKARGADRLPAARRAETQLRRYLSAGGKQPGCAKLLLCSALQTIGPLDPHQPMSEVQESQDLLYEIEPQVCPTEILLTAVDLFQQAGKIEQANWVISAALERHEQRPAILRRAIPIRYYAGREAEVLELARELSSQAAGDPLPWRYMSFVYQDRVAIDQLVEVLRTLIRLEGSVEDRLLLITSLVQTGDAAAARAELQRLQAESPEASAAHPLAEAALLHLEGEAAVAMEKAELALRLDPANAEAWLLLGKLHLAAGDYDAACLHLENMLALQPSDSDANYLLGQACARRGDTARAEQYLERFQRLRAIRAEIHRLERRAGRNARDSEARQELVRLYDELEMPQHADFWRRAGQEAGG